MQYFIGLADKRIPIITTQNNRIQGLAVFTNKENAQSHINGLKANSNFEIFELGKELLIPDFILIMNAFYMAMRFNKQGIIHRLPPTNFGDIQIYLDPSKTETTIAANFIIVEFLRLPELQQTAFRDDFLFYHNGYTTSIVKDTEDGRFFAVIKRGAYDSADDMKANTTEQPHIVPSQPSADEAKQQAMKYINSRNN